eukprot:1162095-Pelagomonas_calceolata.AAC.6
MGAWRPLPSINFGEFPEGLDRCSVARLLAQHPVYNHAEQWLPSCRSGAALLPAWDLVHTCASHRGLLLGV